MPTPISSTSRITAATAVLMLFTSISSMAQPDPYSACIAEAGPIFGSTMTIENLRQYMAEHSDCMTKTVEPTVYMPTPATPNGFTTTDLADITTTYAQNEPQFKREYVGRQFQGKMILRNVKDNMFDKTTRVEFGSAFCVVPRGSINGINNWKPSDKFEVTGVIKDVWFGNVQLDRCSFRS
jgi:hypothetical protein